MNRYMLMILILFMLSPFTFAQDETVEKLLRDLDDDDLMVRQAATDKLIELWEDDAVKKWLEEAHKNAKEKENYEVAERTKQILDRIAFRRMLGNNLMNILGDKEEELYEANNEANNEAKILEFLEQLLKDTQLDEKQKEVLGIWLVKRLQKQEIKIQFIDFVRMHNLRTCAGVVAQLLKDKDAEVRRWSAGLLALFKAIEYTEKIAELLKDDGASVRFQAALALGQLGAREYVKDIAALLEEQGSGRACVVLALGLLGAKEYAKDIAVFLKTEENYLRRHAVVALGYLGASEYIEDIAMLLTNEPAEVQADAAFSLGLLGARQYAKQIAALLKSEFTDARAKAALALGQLDATEYTKDISELLNDESNSSVYMDGGWETVMVKDIARKVLKNWGIDPEKIRQENK